MKMRMLIHQTQGITDSAGKDMNVFLLGAQKCVLLFG